MQMPMLILLHVLRKRFSFSTILPHLFTEQLFLWYDWLLTILNVLAVIRRHMGESFGKFWVDPIDLISSFTQENHPFVVSVQELRDIAAIEAVKGKHFFLETDIKGPGLKLDNTGKAILTVSICSFNHLCSNDKFFILFFYITEDDFKYRMFCQCKMFI